MKKKKRIDRRQRERDGGKKKRKPSSLGYGSKVRSSASFIKGFVFRAAAWVCDRSRDQVVHALSYQHPTA